MPDRLHRRLRTVRRSAETYEISDNVDWERGHHSFRFGATGILRNMEYFRPIAGKGYFNFGNGDFTGFPTAEMLIGFTDSYSDRRAERLLQQHCYERRLLCAGSMACEP